MIRIKAYKWVCFFVCVCTSMPLYASELIYTPVNPSFGGSYLNGGWLLSQAQAQDDNKGPSSSYSNDPLEDFENNITRQVLYQLSRRIVDTAFGDYNDDLASGHYDFGDYSIDINADTGNGVGVSIMDTLTGETTTVEVPYYQ